MQSNRRTWFYAVVIYSIFSLVVCVPTISSVGSTKKKVTGDVVVFECKVDGLEASQKVVWKFIEHNITISTDTQLYVSGGADKYEVFGTVEIKFRTVADDSCCRQQIYLAFKETNSGITLGLTIPDAKKNWNLRILNLTISDQGTYKCFVQGLEMSVKVIYHLEITDAPVQPPPPPMDVTSCCLKKGVTCGLPLCNSSTSPAVFQTVLLDEQDCLSSEEVLNVIVCGNGGKNHLGCCMRAGVSELCQGLCGGEVLPELEDNIEECIIQAFLIQTCFISGQAWLPGPPVSVSAAVVGNQIMVSWQPPVENLDEVSGYRVNYRKTGEKNFKSTMPLRAATTVYQLTGLELNTEYNIFVVSTAASSGSSLPSEMLVISTRDVQIDADNVTKTIAACCESKGISQDCLDFCKADMFRAQVHPDVYYQCLNDHDKIYRCLSDQDNPGNHSPCCRSLRVPENCTYLCEGKPSQSWTDMLECFMYLPVVATCMLENSGLLPLPPKNTHIVPNSVKSDSVIISWEPPNSDPNMHYVVAWKLHAASTSDWNTAEVYIGTTHKITGLRPSTMYNVVVSTVNDNGSSLTEVTLIVITEAISSVVEKPYNETECCLEAQASVSLDCIHICDHQFRIGPDALSEGIRCYQHLVTMLECASDLRDHTACCAKRQVPQECQGICSLRSHSADLSQFITCSAYTQNISKCFDEGKSILPKAPEQFATKTKALTSITLDWNKPSGPDVTSYIVKYGLYTNPNPSWKEKSTTETFIVIDGLSPDTFYNFDAFSVNENGTSLPSNRLTENTLKDDSGDQVDWVQVWQNRSVCCANSGVSEACQPACHGSVVNETQCIGELDKVIVCAADGRDHSDCCGRDPTFPEQCKNFCKGQISQDVAHAQCLMYIQTMFTCFSEGRGLLPTPPQHFFVGSYTEKSITIHWEPPAENCDNNACTYHAILWIYTETGPTSLRLKDFDSNWRSYTWEGLKPVTQYDLTIYAQNQNGRSLFSTMISVITKSGESEQIVVSHAPGGIIDTGSSVTFQCSALGDQTVTSFIWMYGSEVKSRSNIYAIDEVNPDVAGNYTCTVQFDTGETMFKSIVLNIRSIPRPMSFKADKASPGESMDADLQCLVLGFPDIVSWTKDGQALQGDTKYVLLGLTPELATGNTYSVLRVRSVTDEDFGKYTCTATNKFGTQSLTGDFNYVYPTPSPIPTLPPGTNISECCRSLGVQEKCIPRICTFAIDIEAVAYDQSLVGCLEDFDKFLFCGADGRNHTSCCKSKGLDEYCLPFCGGEAPEFTSSWDMFMCATHASDILDCVQDGHKYIPTAPQNVVAVQKYSDISVSWERPVKNPERTSVYDIYYTVDGKTSYGSVNAPLLQFSIQGVQKNQLYKIWATALNDFGESHKSNTVTLNITKLTPSAPKNLQGSVIAYVNIRIQWEIPKTGTPSGGYAVHYRDETTGNTVIVNTRDLNTRLENLRQNTNYYITVGALNEDGEGEQSNSITIRTSTWPGTVNTQGGDQDKEKKTGLVVGLVLGFLFLLAIAVVIIFIYRRHRGSKYTTKETVAFENPQYGPKITGLPGESASEDNQFQYGHLDEEADADQAYTAYENPIISGPESPATLDLEHQQN